MYMGMFYIYIHSTIQEITVYISDSFQMLNCVQHVGAKGILLSIYTDFVVPASKNYLDMVLNLVGNEVD